MVSKNKKEENKYLDPDVAWEDIPRTKSQDRINKILFRR